MTLHAHEIDAGTVRLFRQGRLMNTFDFSACGFSPVIAGGLARALVSQFGHTSLESQRQTWRCLRKFALFLNTAGVPQEPFLPEDVLLRFREWLSGGGLSGSTAQSVLNIVGATLGWCSRNVPEMLASKTNLLVRGFVRGKPAARAALSSEEVKSILAACYEEIEAVEYRLMTGRRILSQSPTNAEEAEQAVLISKLLALGGGDIPRLKDIHRSRLGLGGRVVKLGGTRAIVRNLWLTTEGLFPFFLAILTQTSGNPYAVLSMKRDCLRPHPLREDLERVVWTKLRSHSEQHAEFPVGRRWSAPELCRRLSKLNEPLLAYCQPEDQTSLFICKRSGREVGPMKFQMLHILLDAFIERHRLPNFDLKDLRVAGASIHHHATGSILAAQKRLNHRSLAATASYTKIDERALAHDAVIRKFQGKLMSSAESGPQANCPPRSVPSAGHETVFGFYCADPFSGIAPGSATGKLCLQFQRCATCPGALIPLDDVHVVARLLATSQALSEARERSIREGWWPRFREVYESTLVILQEELLPAVAPSLRDRAAGLSIASTVPHLE